MAEATVASPAAATHSERLPRALEKSPVQDWMAASGALDPCGSGGSQTRPLNEGGAPGRCCWACACIGVMTATISGSVRVILLNMVLLLVSKPLAAPAD